MKAAICNEFGKPLVIIDALGEGGGTITDLIAHLGLPADVVSIATINGKQVSDLHQSMVNGDVVMLSSPTAGG